MDVNPGDNFDLLTHCAQKRISIVRLLLRDPEVLVLMRPLGLVTPKKHLQLRQLLRAWQVGGGARTLIEEAGGLPGSQMPRNSGTGSQMIQKSGTGADSSHSWAVRRTIIVSSEDMGDENVDTDVFVDLDQFLDGGNRRKSLGKLRSKTFGAGELIYDHKK